MDFRRIKRRAKAQGFIVKKEGAAFTIRDMKFKINPVIRTDWRGLEAFIMRGIDDYLHYCDSIDVEPF